MVLTERIMMQFMGLQKISEIMKKSLGLQRNSHEYFIFFNFLSFYGIIIYSFYEKGSNTSHILLKYLF